MYSVVVLCPHRQEHLPNCHPGAHSLGLSESTTHTGLEPASRWGHVRAQFQGRNEGEAKNAYVSTHALRTLLGITAKETFFLVHLVQLVRIRCM
jgi:hypothetical protein